MKSWEWWGDFEADLPVRARRRFSRRWLNLISLREARAWGAAEIDAYIERLASPRE